MACGQENPKTSGPTTWVDCRGLRVEDPDAPWNRSADGVPELQPLMTAWQVAALERRWSQPPDWLRTAPVTVPDFLNYARLLSTGQAGLVASLPGSLMRVALAGMAVAPYVWRHPLRAARKDFWVVAGTLLRYDLALLPKWHQGPVLLHAQVADMGFATEQERFMGQALAQMGQRGRAAGIHTQQLPGALSCLARWGLRPAILGGLCLPGDRDGFAAWSTVRSTGSFLGMKFYGEVTSHPKDMVSLILQGLGGEEAAYQPAGWIVNLGGSLALAREQV